MKKPAVFLDRDGTIIDDRGYIGSVEEIDLYPFAIEALGLLQQHFTLFIVTNQSGVARGLITKDQVHTVNNYLVDMLLKRGISIARVYSCYHHRSDNCNCMKPNPYFIHKARDAFGLDIERSFALGDHPHDVDFGNAAGATGLYLLTGHGKKHEPELSPDAPRFEDLLTAARWILAGV